MATDVTDRGALASSQAGRGNSGGRNAADVGLVVCRLAAVGHLRPRRRSSPRQRQMHAPSISCVSRMPPIRLPPTVSRSAGSESRKQSGLSIRSRTTADGQRSPHLPRCSTRASKPQKRRQAPEPPARQCADPKLRLVGLAGAGNHSASPAGAATALGWGWRCQLWAGLVRAGFHSLASRPNELTEKGSAGAPTMTYLPLTVSRLR